MTNRGELSLLAGPRLHLTNHSLQQLPVWYMKHNSGSYNKSTCLIGTRLNLDLLFVAQNGVVRTSQKRS